MTGRHGDVISSGRDPVRPARLPRRWRLAAAVVLLIGGGITVGVLLAVRPAPRPHAGPTLAAPRLIAHANYLAVAPGGRDIWVQQASPPGHLPGDAWLIDRSGRRLSPVLRLRRHILLAATVPGLLTGSVHGGGARLISTANGATLSMRVPPGALIAAVSADDVAWQSPPCRRLACPLHVTSLLTGADTVIALPPGTQTNGQPGAFDQADKRIALALDTISRKHHPAATHIYIIDVGKRRVTQLPGGPLPLTQAATDRGAIVARVLRLQLIELVGWT